jgi:hypothetical protein
VNLVTSLDVQEHVIVTVFDQLDEVDVALVNLRDDIERIGVL